MDTIEVIPQRTDKQIVHLPVPQIQEQSAVTDFVSPQISMTAVEAPHVVGSCPLSEDFAAPMYNQVHQQQIVATVQPQVIVQEIPHLPVVEWIQEHIAETIEVIPQEQIEVQIGDFPVPQEQLIAEVTTLNTSSTSTSSATPRQQSSPANTMAAVTTGVKHDNTVLVDSRCSSSLDEFAAAVYNRVRQKLFDAEETTQNTVEILSSSSTSTLDSCVELLTPVTALIDNIEKGD